MTSAQIKERLKRAESLLVEANGILREVADGDGPCDLVDGADEVAAEAYSTLMELQGLLRV